ncbi:DUF3618 domain-containing protein [soil metagenome]
MSPEEIENEVEQRRANVEGTLESLKERMSFRRIADEVGTYVQSDDIQAAFGAAAQKVRNNPVAIALIAAGLGWLAFGGRSDDADIYEDPYRLRGDDDRWERGAPVYGASVRPAPYGSSGAPGYQPGMARDYETGSGAGYRPSSGDFSSRDSSSGSESTFSSLKERASSMGASAGEAVSDAYERGMRGAGDIADRAGDMARSASERISSGVRGIGDTAGSYGSYGASAGRSVTDAVRREPLLVGAAALGAGIALGLVLRSTRTEDRWMGPAHDRAFDAARDVAEDAKLRAAHALRAGVDAASEAAEDEGLKPEGGGKTIAERVENVARAGVAEARSDFEGKTGKDERDAGKPGAGSTGSTATGSTTGSTGSTTGSTGSTTGSKGL